MVSVCMATYNGEEFISEQINSILIQLNPNDELVVSDDSSTDHTVEIIKNVTDSRVRLWQGKHLGTQLKIFKTR